MKRLTLINLGAVSTIGVILFSCPGCMVPVGSPAARTASNAPSLANKDRDRAAPNNVNERAAGASVKRLRVNAETVEANELWWDLRDELAGKAEALSPEQYRQYVAERAAQLIVDKIAEMLLYQRASLRVAEDMTDRIDKYVDAELRKIVATRYDGVQRRYERDLESKGQTLDEIRQRFRREIIVAGFLEQEIKPRVAEPTRAELLALYEEAADSFRRPARRRMSLIDVRILDRLPKDVTEPTRQQWQTAKEEALSRVQTAQAELRSGVAFAGVAQRYSDGLHKPDGGAWGWISKGSVRERFVPAVEVLYDLDAGHVSDIIETEHGFFLVRCDELDPGFSPTFEALQPQLKERYSVVAYNQSIAELVTEMRGQARIEPTDLTQFHNAVVDAALRINDEAMKGG